MLKKIDDILPKLERAAAAGDGQVYRQYSGRCMFGKTCIGFVTSDPHSLIAEVGVTGARTDSMGRETIVYWPSIADNGEGQ